jgi:hypothetical protein
MLAVRSNDRRDRLYAIVVAPVALHIAQIQWMVSAAGMILFAWLMVSRWMTDRQQVAHATPAWPRLPSGCWSSAAASSA